MMYLQRDINLFQCVCSLLRHSYFVISSENKNHTLFAVDFKGFFKSIV